MILRCASCGAMLTTPVRRVPDARLLSHGGRETRTPPGTWTEHGGAIHIHPHDLIVAQVKPSGFGCCGYSPRNSAPNLRCACGAMVGAISDECALPFLLELRAVVRDGEGVGEGEDETALPPLGALRFLDANADVVEDARWDVEVDPALRTVGDLRLTLTGNGAIVCDLFTLRLPGLVLARAIALGELPIGPPALCIVSCHMEGNVIVEEQALTRVGDNVQLITERAGQLTRCAFPHDWLAPEWQRAIA